MNGQLTQEEVAAIMTARGRVFQIEKTALAKLKRDPILRLFFDNLHAISRRCDTAHTVDQ